MTDFQKDIIEKLLLGYNIASSGRSGFRLRSPQNSVAKKFSSATFDKIKKYLRKKDLVFVADKKMIRSLHGKSWVKKQYKKMSADQKKTAKAVSAALAE